MCYDRIQWGQRGGNTYSWLINGAERRVYSRQCGPLAYRVRLRINSSLYTVRKP